VLFRILLAACHAAGDADAARATAERLSGMGGTAAVWALQRDQAAG
jgi:hypothetical protein